jgi:hypothetical protein
VFLRVLQFIDDISFAFSVVAVGINLCNAVLKRFEPSGVQHTVRPAIRLPSKIKIDRCLLALGESGLKLIAGKPFRVRLLP